MYPYPPDGGGKIKTLNTIKTLAKEFEIYAIFVSEEQPSKKELCELEKLGIKIKVFYSDRILASVKDDYPNLLRKFLIGIPHYVFQYSHPEAANYIQEVINNFKPDIIHIDHLNIAQYLPKEKDQIWILEHHNVEAYLYWTRLLHSRKLTRKLYLLIEMILTYLYEWKTLPLLDHIFTISEIESKRTQKLFGVKKVSAQPFVYPVLTMKRRDNIKPYILFIGNLGWPPNEDAVEWFLKQILPDITKQVPNVEFHVVGKRQPDYEKHWPKPKNLFLHGYQKSLTPFLRNARVFVMPFRMGGGMRIKSLTALASGLPIITTPLGVEGLHVIDKQEVLIAKTEKEFAKLVAEALNSKQLRNKLSNNASQYIQKNHGSSLNNLFLKKYDAVVTNNLAMKP